MAEGLRESGISFGPLEPWLELLDLPFERPAVDHQIADDRQVAQRLDRHIRLNRLPTRQHLAAVHTHRASAAHLGSAEPPIGEIGCLVVGDPVERIEYTHPLAVRNAEFRKPVRAAHAHGNGIALR